MNSIDTDLLLLISLTAFAIWLLATIWQYVAIQSRKGLQEQEQDIFGHGLHPENRQFMAVVIPRFGSPLSFLVALVVLVLLGFATVLGYL